MNMINSDSIELILEISKSKKKLIKSIVPDHTAKHIDVIAGEIKAMIIESLQDKEYEEKSTVTKVDIE